MSLASANKIRLSRVNKGRHNYSEVWELQGEFWKLLYDSEGTDSFEPIAKADFGEYARCFDTEEALP